jgi:hypothetical protein
VPGPWCGFSPLEKVLAIALISGHFVAQQLWQLRRDPPRLILGEHLGRRTPAGLFLGFAVFVSENHP